MQFFTNNFSTDDQKAGKNKRGIFVGNFADSAIARFGPPLNAKRRSALVEPGIKKSIPVIPSGS